MSGERMPKNPVHILYRFYNANDELLYIGITLSPKQRYEAHSHDKEWFSEAVRSTMTHYATRGELVIAERAAIQNEQPRYNRAYSTLPPPIVMKTKDRRGSAMLRGGHASHFTPPDAIATDYVPRWRKDLESQHRGEQQLAELRSRVSSSEPSPITDP